MVGVLVGLAGAAPLRPLPRADHADGGRRRERRARRRSTSRTAAAASPGTRGASTSRDSQPVSRPGIADGDTAYYRYTVIVCALMFLLALLHVASKPGRAWASIRESEPAALAAGVNIVHYKLWAFALASFMTGVAGCLLAAQVGAADARSGSRRRTR